jgi:F-type H+-transporting ATPase subunit epsilon
MFNNQVTVLADAVERVEDIDVDRARRALEAARAEVRLAQATYDEDRISAAENAVERASNRIRAAGG